MTKKIPYPFDPYVRLPTSKRIVLWSSEFSHAPRDQVRFGEITGFTRVTCRSPWSLIFESKNQDGTTWFRLLNVEDLPEVRWAHLYNLLVMYT